jgi:hypothetical protein
MKTNIARTLIAAAALAVAAPVYAQEAEPPVAVKTDGLPPQLQMRLQEKAQQGQTAVIQYINRTRNVHNLRAEDVIKPLPADAAAKGDEQTRVAKKDKDSKENK